MAWWAIVCILLGTVSGCTLLMAVALAVLTHSAVWLKRNVSQLEKVEKTRREIAETRAARAQAREAKRNGN